MPDIVALIKEMPEKKLSKGQEGTIVEGLDGGVYEIEFADKKGRTITRLALKIEDMMLLHFVKQEVE